MFFLGPRILIAAQNSIFCYRSPDFVNSPFVAIQIDFPTFCFRVTAVFLKKKTGRSAKKSSLVQSNSNSLSVLSAQALRARAGHIGPPNQKNGIARYLEGQICSIHYLSTAIMSELPQEFYGE